METVIVSEWLKAFYHRGETPSIYYWRSRDGLEIDLIVERNDKIYPMEIKSTSTLRPDHAGSIIRWRRISGIKTQGLIFANIHEAMPVAEGVKAVPWFAI
ncbi:MAG: hypothetical protein COT35_00730 [Nitrospirae bacterium CG08_land_8_20_14_0_20_52_24]|nr:DUF4143 domain-containing protein [Deltaproteobacteria bacterium]PIS38461.1 MAG: hypothetical protein COT35_00730 [Nitrospirae bacterium CG08_land_8_20_14_0_20_52_24]